MINLFYMCLKTFFTVSPQSSPSYVSYPLLFIFVFISSTSFVNAQDKSNNIPSYFNTSEEIEELKRDIDNVEGIEDEFKLLIDQYASIASKKDLEVSKAPSVITFITEKQIEDMYLRKLTDALALVPGFDILKDASFGRVDTNPGGNKRLLRIG